MDGWRRNGVDIGQRLNLLVRLTARNSASQSLERDWRVVLWRHHSESWAMTLSVLVFMTPRDALTRLRRKGESTPARTTRTMATRFFVCSTIRLKVQTGQQLLLGAYQALMRQVGVAHRSYELGVQSSAAFLNEPRGRTKATIVRIILKLWDLGAIAVWDNH